MRRIAVVATLAALVVIAISPAVSSASGKLRVLSLSSRADNVSGGEALIAVDVPGGVKPSNVGIRRNGAGVTSRFSPSSHNPRRLIGLVSGLRSGGNVISAWAPGLNRAATLNLFNTGIKGPVFSGPHQSPFYCRTEDNGLGPATDADCSAPTKVEYRYRATDSTFKPLPDPAVRPADMVQTTTSGGQTVDYVIRIQSGVINRSVYRWAILAPGGNVGTGWNHRLIFSFGGGCSAGHEQGTAPVGAVLDNRQLSRGYTVASSSLNVLGTACNDVLSAETASMVKEHVIESLGEAPAWTIGEGGSGGSVQIQMTGQNYPGLLDGLIPSASFPDNTSSSYPDCRLLNTYFATPAGSTLSGAQRSAISGLSDPNGCVALSAGADVVNDSEGCNEAVVPIPTIFDPVTNPGGIRCSVFDSLINVYGTDPNTGGARRPLDNVGVQYGLNALQNSDISVHEFLNLNQGIGGFDHHGYTQAARTVANADALGTIYRTGRVNIGAGGIPNLPIIDTRTYVDNEVNVHQYINTYRFRARLLGTNGTYANQVMFRAAGGQNVNAMNDTALDTLATWLDQIRADGSSRSQAQKVIADKPANAVDACWTAGGQRTDGPAVIGINNLCENTYSPHSLPDLEAGKPLNSIVGKCQLKPINPADYPALSPTQQQTLASTFPGGVCDYAKTGVGEQALKGTWLSFGPKHTIKRHNRGISFKAKPRKLREGAKSTLVARLRSCPETTWQTITFERKSRGRWHPLATRIGNGHKCEARVRVKIKRKTSFRVRAKSISGYASAGPKRQVVRLRG